MTAGRPRTGHLGRLVALNVGVAASYAVTGRLGLLLAVPPGYATALWLPSGIAVSAALTAGPWVLPGIFLGSLVANLWLTLERGGAAALTTALVISVLIALGAAAQAGFGARLAHMGIKGPLHSPPGRALTRLLALAGPVACLTGATWGNFSLWVNHLIVPSQIPLSWLTWWVGDVLGVGLVLPLWVMTANSRGDRLRRLARAGLPVLLSLAVAVALFERSSTFEQRAVASSLRHRVQTAIDSFQAGMERYADVLYALRGYFRAGQSLNQESFGRLARNLIPRYRGLQALEWAPLVTTGAPGGPPKEPLQVPVLYVEPYLGNEPAVGFDLMSESRRQAAIMRAVATGRVTATEPIELVQDQAKKPGFLLFLPVDQGDGVAGFLVAVFRTDALLAATLSPSLDGEMAIQVTSPLDRRPLFSSRSAADPRSNLEETMQLDAPGIDGISWNFQFKPTPTFIDARQSLQSWGGLAGSILFSSFLGVFLVVLQFRNDSLAASKQELALARDAAEGANRAKSTFLANMSHELRTPLGAISGFTELLRDDGLASAERQSYLATIKRNAESLTRLIDDILDLSKVEAGKLAIERVPVSIPDLMTDICSLLLPLARENRIVLRAYADGRVPASVHTDPVRVRQILVNIIGNAVKFTNKGEVAVAIRYLPDAAPGGGRLAFSVKDTGAGISPEQRGALFRPFSQADTSPSRRFGGSGLGLALSRSLAQALGGGVELVASDLGLGSTFRATIATGSLDRTPFIDHIDLDGRSESTSAPSDPRMLQGIDILLVEDAPDNRFFVSRLLSRLGASVTVAGNGVEGVEKALAGSFHVVLMDLQMPELDGIEATKLLRRRGFTPPIIALTAHAMREERERSREAGCNDHLTKPINYAALVDSVVAHANHPRVDPRPTSRPQSDSRLSRT